MRKVLFLFGELSDGDVEWLSQVGAKRAVPAGTVLVEQGRPIDAVFVVLDGLFSVAVGGPQPRELQRIGCGEVVGELSFLDSRPPAATVRAVEPSAVLAIPRATLATKLTADAPFAARFYHALGILLASRLRNNLGYMPGESLREDTIYDDELDPALLDHVALASVRFDRMLKRLGHA
jgi:CRP-like cAMP-binding protein